jgi:ribosome-binding protein aMBF1 (putative translation factor)
MSQRLIALMEKKIRSEGPSARQKLALSIGRRDQMIDRYMKGTSIPRPEQARILAKECGASDEVAEAVARDCFPTTKKKTA